MSRRAIVVWFDREENTVEFEPLDEGLSSFDVTGALALALEMASAALPVVPYPEYTDSEEEE